MCWRKAAHAERRTARPERRTASSPAGGRTPWGGRRHLRRGSSTPGGRQAASCVASPARFAIPSPPVQNLRDLLSRIADRDAKRSEATVQADVRTLLLEAPFQLSEDDLREVHLESPAGERRRIDVETGTTVIEVKRDL